MSGGFRRKHTGVDSDDNDDDNDDTYIYIYIIMMMMMTIIMTIHVFLCLSVCIETMGSEKLIMNAHNELIMNAQRRYRINRSN